MSSYILLIAASILLSIIGIWRHRSLLIALSLILIITFTIIPISLKNEYNNFLYEYHVAELAYRNNPQIAAQPYYNQKIEDLKTKLNHFIKRQNKWRQAALIPDEIAAIAASPFSLFKEEK